MTLDDMVRDDIKKRAVALAYLEGVEAKAKEGSYADIAVRRKVAAIGNEIDPAMDEHGNRENYNFEGSPVDIFDNALVNLRNSCQNYLESIITLDNVDDILSEVSGHQLLHLAVKIKPKKDKVSGKYQKAAALHEAYLKFQQSVTNGDLGAYTKSIRSKYARAIIEAQANAEPQKIMRAMHERLKGMEMRFFGEFSAKGENGQLELKEEEAAGYIGETYVGSSEGERKKFNPEIGRAYAGEHVRNLESERPRYAAAA